MMRQQDYSPELTDLADLREGPGVMILTTGGQLQYINRRSWDLIRQINESTSNYASKGLLPTEVTEICQQVHHLRRAESNSKDWEQVEIRRMAGRHDQPVLLRGFGLPGKEGEYPRVLIMMETVSRRETSTHHAKERFQLTEREQSVVERLAKGWTNKEIAAELKITEPTVKAHIRHIMDKTKCTTRTGIVAQVLHA